MMISVQEIESACDASQPLDFSRHDVEAPELVHTKMFYPYGFPTEVRTNALEIFTHYQELWGKFEKRFDTDTIRVTVHVVEGQSTECPPGPTYRVMMPLMVIVADGDNYAIADLAQNKTQVTISWAAVNHSQYLRYFFLDSTACQHISTRHTTPVHAGCVALNERGVLLLGDSGAGKSSLSYACARAGWTYIADDSSFLLNGGSKRMIIGNCHQVRFRPTAAELFPELEGLEITPRSTGKPSIEMPMTSFPDVICAQTTHVDFLVFLNRNLEGTPELVPYRREVARNFMRQILYGLPETRAAQFAAIDRLLTAEVFELRYRNLDWAVQRLESLAREGN
jgi:hypothetical protein